MPESRVSNSSTVNTKDANCHSSSSPNSTTFEGLTGCCISGALHRDVQWGVVLIMSLLFLLGEDLHRYCRPDDLDGRMDVPVLQSYFGSRDEVNWGE